MKSALPPRALWIERRARSQRPMATNKHLREKTKIMTDTVRPPRQGEIIEFPNQPARQEAQRLHRCPCCGCRTLRERGGFEMCPVCAWSDGGRDEQDADAVSDGPNGTLEPAPGAGELPPPGRQRGAIPEPRAAAPPGRALADPAHFLRPVAHFPSTLLRVSQRADPSIHDRHQPGVRQCARIEVRASGPLMKER